MNRSLKSLLAGAIGLAILALPAGASEARSSSLLNFQLNALGGFQSSANTFTGQVGWTPRFALGGDLGVRAVVAGSMFKSGFGKLFPVGEAQALASYDLASFQLEAGGGVQTWFGQSLTSPMVGGNIAWRPGQPMFGLIDRVVAGYSYLLASSAQVQEIKLGVGIAL